MSGIKPIRLTEFYRALHGRGLTVGDVAETIYSSRAHVTEVLNGRRPGSQTWRKLARVLTVQEMTLLGRAPDGRQGIVPRGALSHVEQGAQA